MSTTHLVSILSAGVFATSASAQDLSSVQQVIAGISLAACSLDEEVIAVGVMESETGPIGVGDLAEMSVTLLGNQLVATGQGRVIILEKTGIVIVEDGETKSGQCTPLNDILNAVIGAEVYSGAVTASFAKIQKGMAADAERAAAERENVWQAEQEEFELRIATFEERERTRSTEMNDRLADLTERERNIEGHEKLLAEQEQRKGSIEVREADLESRVKDTMRRADDAEKAAKASNVIQLQRKIETCEKSASMNKAQLLEEIERLKAKLGTK